MIIRCHHLREVGIIDGNCCFHCHILAGCVGQKLLDGHEAIYCCAYARQLTDEDISLILAKIPEWQKQENLLRPTEHEHYISSTTSVIPERFRRAYQAIQRLESDERCLAALILGGVARGDTTQHSNMDVIVIVDKSPSYRRRYSLAIGGVKLNLGFISLEIFEKTTYKEIEQHERDWHLHMLAYAFCNDNDSVNESKVHVPFVSTHLSTSTRHNRCR